MRLQEVYEEAEVAGVTIPIPTRVQVCFGRTPAGSVVFCPRVRVFFVCCFASRHARWALDSLLPPAPLFTHALPSLCIQVGRL